MADEVGRQGRKHSVDDVSVDARKGVEDRLAQEYVWNPLAEAYVEGRCEIHVHFRAGTIDGGILGDWCAAIKIAEEDLDFFGSDAPKFEKRERGDVVQGGHMGQPVLLCVRKFVQLPQGIA